MENNTVLLEFFERIKDDAVIDSKHIALFTVLYRKWMENGFENGIRVWSKILMNEAKISSSSTFFHKLGYLHEQKYIIYRPSHCNKEGSWISFLGISQDDSKVFV